MTLKSIRMGLKDFLSYTVNTMATDDLAKQGARASVAMALAKPAWNAFQSPCQKDW